MIKKEITIECRKDRNGLSVDEFIQKNIEELAEDFRQLHKDDWEEVEERIKNAKTVIELTVHYV